MSPYLKSFLFILCLTTEVNSFGYATRSASALYITTLEIGLGSLIIIPVFLLTENLSI